MWIIINWKSFIHSHIISSSSAVACVGTCELNFSLTSDGFVFGSCGKLVISFNTNISVLLGTVSLVSDLTNGSEWLVDEGDVVDDVQLEVSAVVVGGTVVWLGLVVVCVGLELVTLAVLVVVEGLGGT